MKPKLINFQLVCRSELNIWIAAEIEWKLLSPGAAEQDIDTSNENDPREKYNWAKNQKAVQVAKVDVEITLTKRRISTISEKPKINELLLTDEAFLPKQYTLRLEKGVFHPYELEKLRIPEWSPTFGLRLTFDKSPYPTREEWKKPEGAPDAFKFWEWTMFLGRKIPKASTD